MASNAKPYPTPIPTADTQPAANLFPILPVGEPQAPEPMREPSPTPVREPEKVPVMPGRVK